MGLKLDIEMAYPYKKYMKQSQLVIIIRYDGKSVCSMSVQLFIFSVQCYRGVLYNIVMWLRRQFFFIFAFVCVCSSCSSLVIKKFEPVTSLMVFQHFS